MKLRPISITAKDDTIHSWKVEDIKTLEFFEDYIIINGESLERNAFYYPQWRGFIDKLNTIFDLDE